MPAAPGGSLVEADGSGRHDAGTEAARVGSGASHHTSRGPLRTRVTSWDPSSAKVALNLTLDACFVPRASTRDPVHDEPSSGWPGGTPVEGCRVSVSHVVALDGVVDEDMRRALLERITAPGWDEATPQPPPGKWERRTADRPMADDRWRGDEAGDAGLGSDADSGLGSAASHREDEASPRPTWGLTEAALRELDEDAAVSDWAFLEVHARLCALYPEWTISHMPVESLRMTRGGGDGPEGSDAGKDDRYRCDPFVANAAVANDGFRWHIDADPSSFPSRCDWTAAHGDYVNGEPGKPLFVSALVYLNAAWPDAWDAETLFLDASTGVGAFVRPRPGRVVLMDQDVTHRVSPPSALAGRPRYSLVWKLVFFPKRAVGVRIDMTRFRTEDGAGPSGSGGPSPTTIARPEWGVPSPIGSAARLAAITSAMRKSPGVAKTFSREGASAGGALGKRRRRDGEG